ncbi:MAG: VC0807 family protein [Opitutaceae bacterium]
MTPPSPPPKRENLLLNLACNLVLPTIVLMKLSNDRWLGPVWGLVVALIFPLGYGIYDLIVRRKTNFLSILGFASVLLSGGLGLYKVDGFWFAVKEAAIPTIIGVSVLASLRAKSPLVRELLFNDQILDVPRVESALAARGESVAFENLLRRASIWLALSFLGSAVVNFILARAILHSPGGTPEFNAELGRMNALSWPIIVLPSMIVMMIVFWRLLGGLTRLTGLTSDEIFRAEKKKG